MRVWRSMGAAIGAMAIALAVACALFPPVASGGEAGGRAPMPLTTGGTGLRVQDGSASGADCEGAYALLFRDGTMVIKAGNGRPSEALVPESQALFADPMKWFDADSARPGADVPWTGYAYRIRAVVFDESFKAFSPATGERWFAGLAKLGSVSGWENVDTSSMTSVAGMFEGCTSLVVPDLAGLDLSGIEDMGGFYKGCTSLKASGLEGLDLSSVRNASGLFEGCTALAGIDLGRIGLSGATDLSRFLRGCSSLNEVSAEGLGPLKATDLSGFFDGCSSLATLDLSGFSTPCAQRLDGFLAGCTGIEVLDLGDLDASAASDADALLADCTSLKTLRAGDGWRNAQAWPLSFSAEAYRLKPSFQRIAAGLPLPDGRGEYRISDIPLQLATVVMESPYYVKTGRAIRPDVDVMLGELELREGIDYALSYGNNVKPGKASVTVRGKGAFSGGLVVPFTITEPPAKVGDRIVYRTKRAAFTFEVTRTVWKKGVSYVDVALRKVVVASRGIRKLTVPASFAMSGRRATVTAIGEHLAGSFKDVTTIEVGGKVSVIGRGAFERAAKTTRLYVSTASLKTVKGCLKGSKVTKVVAKTRLSDVKRAQFEKWFTRKAGKKGIAFFYA